MNAWIGHYKDNPSEWFVVWAKNKHEAFLQIEPIVGEPDINSFIELTAPGFVDFSPKEDKNLESFIYTPPKEDVQNGWRLVFGGAEGKEDNIHGHIKSHMEKNLILSINADCA